MKQIFTKLLLSLSSFSGVIYFYVVTRQDVPFIRMSQLHVHIQGSADFLLRNALYILVFGCFAFVTLLITKGAFKVSDTLEVAEEKPIESVAVPTYIALFVITIGLSAVSQATSLVVLLILFLFWTRLEKIFYFNPIWLFFGFRFYEVKSQKNNTYTLVTKRDRLKGKQSFENLRRINNYTFLEF
jgi:hypothetical protein